MNIVLLSGGEGKRLWPLSNMFSKQFIKLLANSDFECESMLQNKYRNLCGIADEANITVGVSQIQKELINIQLGIMSMFALNLVAGELFSILLACAYLRDKKRCKRK